MTNIFIGIVVLGIIGFVLHGMNEIRSKRKKRENEIKKSQNNFTPEERRVVQIVNSNMENQIVPVTIVRDKNQKIPQYGNQTWFETEKKNIKQTAGAFFDGGEIFIKRFNRKTNELESMERFAKLYIHEAAHTLGLRHGEEMSRVDRGNITKILPILKKENLI